MAAVFSSKKETAMNKPHLRRAHLALLILAPMVLISVFVLSAADTSSSLPAPPVAKKEPKITDVNGQKLVDNYYWLRDKKNPAVKAYLEAENAYTDAVMKPTEPQQNVIGFEGRIGGEKGAPVSVVMLQ